MNTVQVLAYNQGVQKTALYKKKACLKIPEQLLVLGEIMSELTTKGLPLGFEGNEPGA